MACFFKSLCYNVFMEFLRKNLPIIGILIIGLLAYVDNRFGRIDSRFGQMENRFGRLESELRAEIKDVRTELKVDIVAVRTELKEEIKAISHKLDTLILTISHQKQAHNLAPPKRQPSSKKPQP